MIAAAPGRSQVATEGEGGRGGYCYNFISEARAGLRLVGMICRALPLLSPSGLFQASAVRGNLSGLFSEIESASQRVDGRGRGRGSQCFVLDNN